MIAVKISAQSDTSKFSNKKKEKKITLIEVLNKINCILDDGNEAMCAKNTLNTITYFCVLN